MKTIQINIGLNNNPFTYEQVKEYFETHKDYRLMACYEKDMTFQGGIEPTFVAMMEYNYRYESKILAYFEILCSVMTQESIAISTDSMEVLAFNPRYDGERYRFDPQYFEYNKR
jgi:hypothetical protein